ncbi:MAG: 50S ribosomal protein L18 [Thermoleophilia bacterium]|jgi:large subunit ribosomal protein L18|nr:50S ribosomal protein L18 [Thermoleophilia bacterium]
MAKMTPREARLRRHRRIRGKVHGTAARPRLCITRSNLRIYAQLIDDDRGHTVAAAGSHEAALKGLAKGEAATAVGRLIAERGKAAGVGAVVFDRGGYLYHGRVRALAEGAREGGLEF